MTFRTMLAGAVSLLAFATTSVQAQTTLTIGTVNNSDMIRMQGLTDEFEKAHPDVKLNWVTLEENILRQRVTTDIATKGGQFDVMTIGTYEVPIWSKNDWLVPLENLGADYDVDDLLPPIRAALSTDDKLYAAPFYAESVMTLYRKDLFEKAGLEMPEKPTWDFIADAAAKITDKDAGVYGICLRGKPGWGENMAFLGHMARSYGASYFDADWKPQFESEGWKKAVGLYVDMLTNSGPPGVASNGFNETLSLFGQGKCGMWMDATVAASFVTDPKQSQVADQVGFAPPPCGIENCPNEGANWLWAWSLAIPAGSQKTEAAETFIGWATSKAYLELVAEKEGWANVPPGTRTSLYENAEYLKAAPFAEQTLKSINNADPSMGEGKPYVGLQFAAIPEFQGLGTAVGQQMAAALSGSKTVDEALAAAQSQAEREMTRAGYPK
ncbi:sugar ABC transporter substrate-binding protein [Aurantimonas sp. C2-6-R+9]|uniref:ABC transporter substrate-binding protein n=1 Tax=unclassified Aurantimonas TaxID=2638230 RepID=UPI002E16FDCE|nr:MULTISPECIES: sugar ABC transporter substrate-binding protein [unclassified Aurantimonas]MEC5291685.1 sugar ABC transporter substrate-binding protein [Aurantimonas sp. C2-3-R2]MEC5323560.1 sugar ABC transporter substrate-binding protein [Aurantimonas sp. A3-2-R12]MEC5381867.1 sugar ABC transporter substrate-binding protein [Aurantimonas sp. C2-6-R+9]MEC5412769.1 sugar ABC transporter substrate-binding protein [Aurantimonas sp. C2-4-R8]